MTDPAAPGWQQPPTECPHLGALFASLGAGLYPVGAEWVCTCGQVFVVVKTDQGKRLTPRRSS